MLNRRELLRNLNLVAVAAGLPTVSFARADTDVRLVLFILRGAVDGLALAPAYGDGSYKRLRGELAIGQAGDGMFELDGMFGLHPSLTTTCDLFERGEATLIHAVASPYRERSHFDGQDVLENGVTKAGVVRDGWLNRALGPLGGQLGDGAAIAIASNTPLVLRGENPVTSWAPSQLPDANDDTIRRLGMMYANDEFFAKRLAQALESREIAGDMNSMSGGRRGDATEQWKSLADAAAKFLVADGGPQIAVLEAGGWDTHANQGAATGYLANRLGALDEALDALRAGLGDEWSNTVVTVVTEFGRTVEVNGTRGTDHGTGTAALLLGGALDGGRVIADWPGLKAGDLYEGRDLRPTTDLRSVFKGILLEHMALPEAFIEQTVFPDSASAQRMEGLIRA